MAIHSHPILPSYGFTGHETFPFRLGWLHKGVMAVKDDPQIFSKDEAIVILGVGKNMVRSIRHWCLTLGLITDIGRGVYQTTPLGELVFASNGADPYLEDIGTLWWLHWKLSGNYERCTTWYYVMNYINRPEFSKTALKDELKKAVAESGGRAQSDRTLESDIECFVRTYTSPKRGISEESLECPLVELNILKENDKYIRLNRGEKNTIPDFIFLAALVEFFEKTNTGAKTLLAERILHNEGSPGRIFLLDDNSCIRRLERLGDLTKGKIVYDATAGMRQVLFHSVPTSLEILSAYYQRGQ
ncbi:DUF4007 family protein [Paenibacillus hodogayensis]|uniref:DUF4007 family protein n=1 Tax=Paenibacillus hodogayensis TaxID=279208 RepID=A0ABV5W5Q2_9BACL